MGNIKILGPANSQNGMSITKVEGEIRFSPALSASSAQKC
jgi:hypothetical protein